MGDRLTGPDLKQDHSAPTWQRMSLNVSGIAGYQFDTVLSDGSGGIYGFGLDLGYAETASDKYMLLLQMLWGTTEGSFLPEGGPAVPQSHRSILFGTGHESTRYTYYDRFAKPRLAIATLSQRVFGYGTSHIGNPYEDGGASSATFDISNSTYLLGKVRLGGQAWLDIGPGFTYGVQYAGEGSDFNRLQLALMFQARIGWNGESNVSGEYKDTYLGAGADVQEFFNILHGFGFRYCLNSTLTHPQDAIGDYGFDSSGGGPLEMVPSFMFATSLLGGLTGSMEVPLRSKAYWVYFATYLAGGITFSIFEGKAGRTGGVGDFLKAGRLASYAIAGISSPGDRGGMPEREKEMREEYVNIGNYLLSSAVLAVGQGLDIDILSGAATGSSLNLVTIPDQITDMVEQTYYIPGYAAVSNRAAFTIHNSWKHIPMFSGMTAVWGGTDKPIDINSYMGFEWDGPYHHLFGGLNHNMSFGEGGGSTIGFVGGAGVKIARKVLIDARAIYNPWNPDSKIDAIIGATYIF